MSFRNKGRSQDFTRDTLITIHALRCVLGYSFSLSITSQLEIIVLVYGQKLAKEG